MLAVAQPVFLGLRNVEADGFQLDLEENVLVRAIAQRLIFTLATQAPRVILTSLETHLERLFVVYHSGTGLLIGAVYVFQRVRRYRRFLGFCAEAANLKIT